MDNEIEALVKLEDLDIFALKILDSLPSLSSATVVGLYGDLGAGKTSLSQAMARGLSLSEKVLSPTFVIMKLYNLTSSRWKRLVHIDAYRIENEKEMENLGFTYLVSDPENLVIVEWPEKIEKIMPRHTKIKIKPENENERKFILEHIKK